MNVVHSIREGSILNKLGYSRENQWEISKVKTCKVPFYYFSCFHCNKGFNLIRIFEQERVIHNTGRFYTIIR